MLDKLNVVFQRYNEVNDLIIQPDIISDSKRYVKLNREYKNLKPLVDAREEYLELTSRIEEAKTVLKEEKDPDFRDMAKLELDELEPAFSELEEAIKILLIPKDPEDDKNGLWKSDREPAEMKVLFLQVISFECIKDTVKVKDGR